MLINAQLSVCLVSACVHLCCSCYNNNFSINFVTSMRASEEKQLYTQLNKMALVLLLYSVFIFQVSVASNNNAHFKAQSSSNTFNNNETENRFEHIYHHASANTSSKHINLTNDPFEPPINSKVQTGSNPDLEFKYYTEQWKESQFISFKEKTANLTDDSVRAFFINISVENSTNESNTTEHEPKSRDVSVFDTLLQRNINQSNSSVEPVSQTSGKVNSNDGESRVVKVYGSAGGRIACKQNVSKKRFPILFIFGVIVVAGALAYVWYMALTGLFN